MIKPTNKTGECVCGQTETLGITHRQDGPCYVSDQETTLREWGADKKIAWLLGAYHSEMEPVRRAAITEDIFAVIQEETQRAYERGKNDIDALSGYVEQGRLEERARVREVLDLADVWTSDWKPRTAQELKDDLTSELSL